MILRKDTSKREEEGNNNMEGDDNIENSNNDQIELRRMMLNKWKMV